MNDVGHILLADDEETFLYATADLLRREGYACTCALDAATATQLLSGGDYDLLIADIKMPGNAELELIRELPRVAEGVPVVVVTGYPSLRSAIEAIQLPVMAYLVKPFEFGDLLGQVRRSLAYSQAYRAVRSTGQHLQDWSRALTGSEQLMRTPIGDPAFVAVETFLTLTLGNIVGCLADLKRITQAVAMRSAEQDACQLLHCPRPAALTGALLETIDVLERTKSAFKSKDLGELRKKLERLVKGGVR